MAYNEYNHETQFFAGTFLIRLGAWDLVSSLFLGQLLLSNHKALAQPLHCARCPRLSSVLSPWPRLEWLLPFVAGLHGRCCPQTDIMSSSLTSLVRGGAASHHPNRAVVVSLLLSLASP